MKGLELYFYLLLSFSNLAEVSLWQSRSHFVWERRRGQWTEPHPTQEVPSALLPIQPVWPWFCLWLESDTYSSLFSSRPEGFEVQMEPLEEKWQPILPLITGVAQLTPLPGPEGDPQPSHSQHPL